MNNCICIKPVLDKNHKIIFEASKKYDFVKQEARASTHFGGYEQVVQYRMDSNNLDIPISEDKFNEHFKIMTEHRNSQIETLLNE